MWLTETEISVSLGSVVCGLSVPNMEALIETNDDAVHWYICVSGPQQITTFGTKLGILQSCTKSLTVNLNLSYCIIDICVVTYSVPSHYLNQLMWVIIGDIPWNMRW